MFREAFTKLLPHNRKQFKFCNVNEPQYFSIQSQIKVITQQFHLNYLWDGCDQVYSLFIKAFIVIALHEGGSLWELIKWEHCKREK